MFKRIRLILLFIVALCGCVPGVSAQTNITQWQQSSATSPVLPIASPRDEAISALTVSYKHGLLTISARDATLSDVLREVAKQTGADIDIPEQAGERVVAEVGPGLASEVLYTLLSGSQFNYILVGSESDPSALTRVVLSPRPLALTAVQTEVATNRPGSVTLDTIQVEESHPENDPASAIRAQQNMLQQRRQMLMETVQHNRQFGQ